MRRLDTKQATIEEVNQFLGGRLKDTQALLKLLWTRKEIVWTGTHYQRKEAA